MIQRTLGRACVRCRKDKKRCDRQRPCQRCTSAGLARECLASHSESPNQTPPLQPAQKYSPTLLQGYSLDPYKQSGDSDDYFTTSPNSSVVKMMLSDELLGPDLFSQYIPTDDWPLSLDQQDQQGGLDKPTSDYMIMMKHFPPNPLTDEKGHLSDSGKHLRLPNSSPFQSLSANNSAQLCLLPGESKDISKFFETFSSYKEVQDSQTGFNPKCIIDWTGGLANLPSALNNSEVTDILHSSILPRQLMTPATNFQTSSKLQDERCGLITTICGPLTSSCGSHNNEDSICRIRESYIATPSISIFYTIVNSTQLTDRIEEVTDMDPEVESKQLSLPQSLNSSSSGRSSFSSSSNNSIRNNSKFNIDSILLVVTSKNLSESSAGSSRHQSACHSSVISSSINDEFELPTSDSSSSPSISEDPS